MPGESQCSDYVSFSHSQLYTICWSECDSLVSTDYFPYTEAKFSPQHDSIARTKFSTQYDSLVTDCFPYTETFSSQHESINESYVISKFVSYIVSYDAMSGWLRLC